MLHGYLQEDAYHVSDTFRIHIRVRYDMDTYPGSIQIFIIFAIIRHVGTALGIRTSPITKGHIPVLDTLTWTTLARPCMLRVTSPRGCASPARCPPATGDEPPPPLCRRGVSIPARWLSAAQRRATNFHPCDVDPGNSREFTPFSVLNPFFSSSPSCGSSDEFLCPLDLQLVSSCCLYAIDGISKYEHCDVLLLSVLNSDMHYYYFYFIF